jgi:hypothetical protein
MMVQENVKNSKRSRSIFKIRLLRRGRIKLKIKIE